MGEECYYNRVLLFQPFGTGPFLVNRTTTLVPMFSWTINQEPVTVSFTLFAVIDIAVSIPVVAASLRIKMGGESGLLRQPWYPAVSWFLSLGQGICKCTGAGCAVIYGMGVLLYSSSGWEMIPSWVFFFKQETVKSGTVYRAHRGNDHHYEFKGQLSWKTYFSPYCNCVWLFSL